MYTVAAISVNWKITSITVFQYLPELSSQTYNLSFIQCFFFFFFIVVVVVVH